jgi:predicted PurR-regulated permease PerM
MAKSSVTNFRISVSPQTIFFILGIWFLVQFFTAVQQAILLLFLACIVASALYPIIRWLKRKAFPTKIGILIVYLILLLLASGILVLVGNVIVDEGSQFISNLPAYVDIAIDRLDALPAIKINSDLWSTLSNYTQMVTSRLISVLLSGLDYVFAFIHGAFSLITVLVFSFFLLSDTQYFKKAFLKLFAPSYKNDISQLLNMIACNIGSYARGQLAVMSVTGLLTGLGLYMIGVPYAFILGLLVFLFDIIPIVGPIIAGFIGVTIALAQSPMHALWAGAVYFIAQQIESYWLYPTIMGKATGLHPFWILFSILLGGMFLGVVGIILAVPAAIVFSHTFNHFYTARFSENEESINV